ncbi:hypothetical protein ACWNT8_08970 [Pigmentibacter ruber]|uniref:hypothetical protein n=1 Tax=Pigmentibacter ruber TaxID=2683196 RepID=UPI00131DE4E3|nr:hypothetical protein [Pigmentibacter ruber]BFD32586.1 hypothetical protein GTC16762_22040 [Pigmentibacter ruber]
MGILYPIEDYEIWAKRYDIEIKTIRCDKCGKAITTSKPFALGQLRGLLAENHGCEGKCLASVVFHGNQLKKIEGMLNQKKKAKKSRFINII